MQITRVIIGKTLREIGISFCGRGLNLFSHILKKANSNITHNIFCHIFKIAQFVKGTEIIHLVIQVSDDNNPHHF